MPAGSGQSDWQFLQPGQTGSHYGANNPATTGMSPPWQGGAQAMLFRDGLDARRAQMGQRLPAAQYPDGYLGTIHSRHEDKLLKKLGDRVNQKSYQRGVHKGERIDPSDYFWPTAGPVDMEAGLRAQAVGTRWTAKGSPVEHILSGSPYATDTARELLRIEGLVADPPVANPSLRRLAPPWR